MRRFEGKTAIVSGGSKGMGRAIAERLLAEGGRVLISARGEEGLAAAVSELGDGERVLGVVGDVAEAPVRERMLAMALESWGRVDVLVNNAGTFDEADFLAIERANWDRVLDVDLSAPFSLAQLVAARMAAAGGGAIVNIASIDGHLADGPYVSYGAAKAALIALTKYIAVELAPRGVRCNSISPGWVETPMTEASAPPELLEAMRTSFGRVPIGRLLRAEEIAAACAFLASDEASGVTGADLVVDGGTIADAHILPTLD